MSGIPPGSDFFRHVNEAWLGEAAVPAHEASWGTLDEVRAHTRERTQSLIESARSNSTCRSERLIAALYGSYRDVEEVERRAFAPLADDLRIADEVQTSSEALIAAAYLKARGTRSVFDFEVNLSPEEPSRYLLFVGQSGLGLPGREFYLEDRHSALLEQYQEHVRTMLEVARIGSPGQDAPMIVELERAFAGNHSDRVSRRHLTNIFNPFGLDDLDGEFKLPWKQLLCGIFGFDADLIPTVVITDPDFIRSLPGLLNEQRLEQWRAWLRWTALSSRADYLPSAAVHENYRFFGTVLGGIPEMPPRGQSGVMLVNAVLGDAVGREYVAREWNTACRDDATALARNLIDEFRSLLCESDWMQPSTLAEALHKLDRCRLKIGFPDRDDQYLDLDLDPSDLVGNVRKAVGHRLERMRQFLRYGAENELWDSPAHSVNAYYHPIRNEVLVPAGILQPPYFDPSATLADNYGAIGAVIAHELAHGFDDVGSTFDADGRYRMWWTEEDRARFSDRVDQVVAQFDGLVPTALRDLADPPAVRGGLVAGEALADITGLTVAYRAWKHHQNSSGNPGDAKGFLRAWARVWRQVWRPESLIVHLETNVHPPGEFRVNQVVRNLDAFHDAFGICKGDAMALAPDQRLRL
jgi:putative endopeptidase